MRDIKIVAAFILGSVLMLVPGFGTNWIYRSVHVDFVYAQPVFSARILRFFASDPTSNVSSGARLSIHLDRLAYHLRSPELFELVTFVRKFQKARDSQNKPDIVMGSQTGFNWEEGDCIVGRIVGLPGDTVELVQGNLKINGRAWDERYIAPEYRSEALLPVTTLGPSEYFILPENRRLIDTLKDELVVNRDRIVGRQILNRWPLGWWTFSPTVFLPPQPATQGKAP
jgi:hypothetical protein